MTRPERSPKLLLAVLLTIASLDGAALADDAPAAGIRQLSSQHLTLFTDAPSSPEVDELPALFDLAFPQWCAYFGVDAGKHADWKMRAYLMKSRDRFVAAGYVPANLPEFLNGYARGDQLWLHDQTSPYYRRHLLLHEGTHAFMYQLVQGVGPPWYGEAMAELLATHLWQDGQLTLRYLPKNREEVVKWGRVEIVREDYENRKALTLDKVMGLGGKSFLELSPYGWCWAAASFFDNHPRYQARFRQMFARASRRNFNDEFKQAFAADWPRIVEEWQIYIATLDYGYDFERMEIEFAAGKPLNGKATAKVAADHGWQPSGIALEAGKTYLLKASGRYQVADEPRVWWCEPGGVTIEYYRGQPLGILLAAIRSDNPSAQAASGLIKPVVIGLESMFTPRESGTLYLRINESPGGLGDNLGWLDVEVGEE